ncbi:MAG TPA: BMP family ABC transporter substrate-binding protein [Candidatus Gemmiger stercorigallinarum]|nr:BMP family ABC transporter substrate-binding protein [Candidatus Gemmiger stercorigallinarum]
MTRNEAAEQYNQARRRGQREYREAIAAGRYPYLPVLDDILQNARVEAQLPLGVVEVPLAQVVGTKTAGRTAAFSFNFMPLLGAETEFAAKWINLCMAHVEEGIRDPIRCYEYLGRFYVQEGNKRVSVLKHFGAANVTASVIRVVPQYADNPDIRRYFDFMAFYALSGIYEVQLAQEGGYAKLQAAMGKKAQEEWTDDDRANIRSLLTRVGKAYRDHGGSRMRLSAGDVLVVLLQLYDYQTLLDDTPAGLAAKLDAAWDDVLALERPDAKQVSTSPAAPPEKPLLQRILPVKRPAGTAALKVAFVNERSPATSTWTNAHEFGRTQVDQVFAGQVTTAVYNDAEQGKNDVQLIEQAIADGATLIFTTTPKLAAASLRAAVRHPEVRILNCSMDLPYASIRTYYSRIYEAKFITGAIAGAMAANDRVGFVASYPMLGMPADINAFALGARMTNPRVKVEVQWTCLPGDPLKAFTAKGITVISGRDTPAPGHPSHEYGIFQIKPGGVLQDLASPFWHWGQFYEHVVRSVLDGSWNKEKSGADGKVVNYWWGMNSGVIDVLFSRELPHDLRHLASLLRSGIISGAIDLFATRIVAQDGSLKNDGLHGFSPEEILHMDWLCDAVEGHIPEYDELTEEARPMYRVQGIHRERLPREAGEL